MTRAAQPIALADWAPRLERLFAQRALSRFQRAFVYAETESTQDAARRMNARPGDVVTCGRQTRGRGRQGRTWLDTGENGLAATFVTAAATPHRLSLAAATAAARAIGSLLPDATPMPRIKWPNDVLLGSRKICGVLVEQAADLAFIGIGINVAHQEWPSALSDRAMSLVQAGCAADRLEVLETLVAAFDDTLQTTDEELCEEFRARDWLCGRAAVLRHDNQEFAGVMRSIEPMRSLTIETSDGVVVLPAHSTTLLRVDWSE